MTNKGEIWLANLPQYDGKEQLGKRPVLIISDVTSNILITIPITSNLSTIKYQHTIKIDHSNTNRLNKESVALIFQIQATDKRRLIHKIGSLEQNYINQINTQLKTLLKL
tara:strand:+ start:303 stop:632 length:330 start_codon:yes stop_codon:yes gene_type:complete